MPWSTKRTLTEIKFVPQISIKSSQPARNEKEINIQSPPTYQMKMGHKNQHKTNAKRRATRRTKIKN